jgi:acyl-CoA thioester hydrolase
MRVSRIEYRVIYGDIDAMGVTYYSHHFRWFEIGRTEFLRELGIAYKEVEAKGFLLPVSEAYCKYMKPVYYDTVVLIETRIKSLRQASMRFDYTVLSKENGEKMATGYTVHPCLGKNRQVVRIPTFLLDLLRGVM